MKIKDFAEAIQPELRAIPTPEPTDELLQRILASREAGTRIILPSVTTPRTSRTRRLAYAAVGAAALLVLVPIGRRPRIDPNEVIAVSPYFGVAAAAQASGGRIAPTLPPIRLSKPNGIRPVTLEMSKGSLSLVAANVQNTPAWRMVSAQGSAVETVYVARADLRLLQRSLHVSPYRGYRRLNIQQQFVGDKVNGRMTTDGPSIGAGRTFANPLPKQNGPYLSDAFAPLLLMATQLSSDWKGSASLVGWAVVPGDVFMPINLRVEGEERLRVPAGEFDCWRVSVEFGGRKLNFWARKSDGLGLRVKDGDRDLVVRSIR